MAKILTRCPICESKLHVSELACIHCGSSIRSGFETCRFCRLAPEHLAFVELFLRSEGNMSRVGAELGLSYPTIRNKLSAALAALGFDGSEENNMAARLPLFTATSANEREPLSSPPVFISPEMLERRRIVLENLALGAISTEEAAEALRDT